jgi:modulator of FtsH protease
MTPFTLIVRGPQRSGISTKGGGTVDQATFMSWHDFYVTVGTASASLIGLLFVALSINLDAVTGPSRDDLRAFAEQAFASFSMVLLIAVVFLIPTGGPSSIGVAYLVLGAGAGARMLRRGPAVWRAVREGQLGRAMFWRAVLPAAAVVGLLASGFGLVTNQPSALYWLVAVIIGLLMSAAQSSWDLLLRVSEDRRTASASGS